MEMLNKLDTENIDIDNIKGKCDKCIFGMQYTSDGNLTRICSGVYPITVKEANDRIVKALTTGECETYEEGHARYLEMVESGLGPCDYFLSIPPEKKYTIDKHYSEKPVYGCDSARSHKCIDGGRDIGCYWKVLGCTSQVRLDNPNKMADPSLLKDAFEAAGIDTSKIDYLN